MTSIWFDARIKLPTIKKYLLYWTINWWYGERCGNGFLLCASAVFHLWRQCSQGPQKITCDMKREKSASTHNWWIGGRWGIVFFTVGSLAIWYDVSALSWKWILPAALTESSEHKTDAATPTGNAGRVVNTYAVGKGTSYRGDCSGSNSLSFSWHIYSPSPVST